MAANDLTMTAAVFTIIIDNADPATAAAAAAVLREFRLIDPDLLTS